MNITRCAQCGRELLENTDGNEQYCQGHGIEDYAIKFQQEAEEESDRQLEQLERQDFAQDEQWD